MDELDRLIDGDADSLDARVRRAIAGLDAVAVDRFTYWYTGRPPVHEARILSAAATPRA
jgi:hypothetical protein